MYAKSNIMRYGNAIQDEATRLEFRRRVEGIEFTRNEVCDREKFAEAFKGSPLELLANDFRKRYMEFLSTDEDMPQIMRHYFGV